MKTPPKPNNLLSRFFKNRDEGEKDPDVKPTYEELEQRVRQLEEEVQNPAWTSGLLWENQEMFRRAFDDNPDSIVIIRRSDGLIVDANPGFVGVFGYDSHEVTGKSADQLKTWVSSRDRKNFLDQLAKQGQVIGMEARFRAKDGDIIFGLISAWPIEILGEPCLLTITRDLTENMRAQRLLRIQRDLGIGLSVARSLKDAAGIILKASLKIHGIDSGGVYVVDNETGELELVTYRGLPRSFVSKVRLLAADTPQAKLVMRGKPVYGIHSQITQAPFHQESGLKTLAVIPVEFEGKVVAALNLGSHSLEQIPASAKNAMEGIAARMGGVVARLKAEARLAESEERFSTFMDLLPGMAFMKDSKGRFLFVNRYMTETFGKRKYIGKPMHKVFEAKAADRLVAEDRRAMEEGTIETTGSLNDKDGMERVFRTFKFPIEREGKPRMMGGMGIEITKQVRAEQRLLKALQQLRAVFNTFPGGVHVVDRQFNIVDLSDRLLKMYDLPNHKAAIGKKCYRLYRNRKTPCPECSVPQAMKTGKVVTRLMEGDQQDQEHTFKIYSNPVKGEDGAVWGAIECIMDVTDLKLAEQRTRNALEENELLLKEVNHRVKNNMQVISALLTLQAAQFDDEKIKTAFTDSQNRIKAMAIAHETLYKAENLTRIQLKDYVSTLADSLFAAFGANERSIKMTIDAPDIQFSVDRAIPCGMIINELFTNSLKHAFPKGGPGVIQLSARPDENGGVEMVVQDNGRGIPEDFDLAQAKTLGIGLVVGLVENQLGGTIEAENENGARFTLRFPL